MNIRNLTRWQAFAGHLGFSLALGVAVFALFRFLWYPDALFTLAGAGKLMLLVVGIDVILGPSLTLFVFNPNKKSLVFDLSVIVLIQLVALGYGVWVMAQSRPVFLVGATDRFELVTANQIAPEQLVLAPNTEWQQLSWTGPILVGAVPPQDPDERLNLTMSAMQGGADVTELPRYFVPISRVVAGLVAASRPLSDFEHIAPGDVTELRAWMHARGLEESSVAVLPLKARSGTGAVLIDRKTAQPLRSVMFDGYSTLPKDDAKSKASGAEEQVPTGSHANLG